jgi:tetratricopeptide (TPR) repeat protein
VVFIGSMFRLLAWWALSGCLLAWQGDSQSPERCLQEAIGLHQKGDFEGAIAGYRAYLKLRPEAVDARSNLGAALAHLGRYEQAIAEYKRALEKDPKNPGVMLNLGLAYYKVGQFDEAAQELAAARVEQPDNGQALLLLADCRLRLGENKEVIKLLTPLEKSGPADLAVAYMLGTALVRDQQTARGQVLIERILRNGDSAEARLLLGTTKMIGNDYAGARADLQRAVELNPKLPDVYSYYGLALLRTGDTTSAAEAFRKELEANPNDFTSNLQLGALARQDQENEKALGYLERALLLRPGDPGARFQIAAAHLALGEVEQSRAELEQLIAEAPEFPEAHVTLATIYYRLKRKADGDRERRIAEKLEAGRQAKEPGVQAVGGGAAKQ